MDFKKPHLSHPGQRPKPATAVIATGTDFRQRVKKCHPTLTLQIGECSGVNGTI